MTISGLEYNSVQNCFSPNGSASTVYNGRDRDTPLPTIVAQVIGFDANNPKNSAADLEKLIVPDKAISAGLLRVSNSAFYGRSGKVKILRDALAVLGIKATKPRYLSQHQNYGGDVQERNIQKALSQPLPDLFCSRRTEHSPRNEIATSGRRSFPIRLFCILSA
ncbi:MAG: HDOD domain-containing protein [Turneriella sp.]